MEWLDAIEFFTSAKFKRIAEFLKTEREAGKIILPPRNSLLRAFRLTPLNSVRAVILGQDPYPTSNPVHAHGLAFSVVEGISPLPKSLQNIFRELKEDCGVTKTSGDLTKWAEQGVLLLNTSLSVEAHKPASHSDLGWGALANEVLRYLNEHTEHTVFILWGAHAKQKSMLIDRTKHLVIESAHPSPLSAYRGFFGSKPFSRTNKYLIEHGKDPIRW